MCIYDRIFYETIMYHMIEYYLYMLEFYYVYVSVRAKPVRLDFWIFTVSGLAGETR